ncbi:hypothetical protein [Streptomyces sp. NPDC056628]|uniref:hypothetical protein n=1 Tax=Streptomyces sp. NPDC056628 TaxID=3345882 RepID=UPI0036B2BD22
MSTDGHQELAVTIGGAVPPCVVGRLPGRVVRRRDAPGDAPAGLGREQAAGAHFREHDEPSADQQLVEALSRRHAIMILS